MTLEKHLRRVSREVSQRLGILTKYWQVFQNRLLIGRCFRGFVLPVLDYCSAVLCLAADTHLKLLHCVVSSACFLTLGMFRCDLAHCRSVAALCMLYKIRCDPMHPLWCSTCAVCAITRGCDRTSIHLFASSLQNLAVQHDFYSPVSIFVGRS